MKVKDLMQRLAKCDQDSDVFCYTEDLNSTGLDTGPFVLQVLDVSSDKAVRARLKDGTVGLKFGYAGDAVTLLEVSRDF